jgi:hypothetical protein
MSGTGATKNDRVIMLQTMGAAARQYLANKTLVLHGKAMKAGDVVELFQTQVTVLQQADALRLSWSKAVAANKATWATQIAPTIAALKTYVAAMFGPDSAEYAAFGFAVKQVKRSIVNKVAAVAQSLATRAARHTLGKNQRQAIKGVVQTSATPAVAPASAPAATQSATATSPSSPAIASTSSPNGSNGRSQ